MPTLSINLKLRRDSARELTFEEVDGNFLELKDAIVTLNDSVNGCAPVTHSHPEITSTVGMVAHFALTKAPAGWLVCDGSAVSRTTYARLFVAMGVAFGVGDGVNTFNLPDLRGEFIRGFDGGRGVDSGRTFGSWQKGSLMIGDPSVSSPGVGNPLGKQNYIGGTNGTVDPEFPKEAGMDHVDPSVYPNCLNGAVAASHAHNLGTGGWSFGMSRPRNVALLPCVKF